MTPLDRANFMRARRRYDPCVGCAVPAHNVCRPTTRGFIMRPGFRALLRLAATLIGGSLAACGPGASTELLPVGSACTSDSQCGPTPFMCLLDHPGGYCMRQCQTDTDCPSEAVCVVDTDATECHKRCPSGQSDCRSGYECMPAASTGYPRASAAFCDVAASPDGGMTDSGADSGG